MRRWRLYYGWGPDGSPTFAELSQQPDGEWVPRQTMTSWRTCCSMRSIM